MDIILLIIHFLEIFLTLIIAIFLLRIYNETRYLPTSFLALFFFVTSVQFILFLPSFFPFEISQIRIFLDISNYLIFIMFLIFILAIEGMQGNHLSLIFTSYGIFTAFLIGFFMRAPIWNYYFDPVQQMWMLPDFGISDIFSLVHLLIAFILIFYRLTQYVRGMGDNKKKRIPIIVIFAFVGALIGATVGYSFGLEDIANLSVLIGIIITALLYIKFPNSFFLSNTRIQAILFIEANSQVVISGIGKYKEGDLDLAAAGLGGVMILLQEILQESEPPTRLIHGNKGFLIEHDTKNQVFAIMIVDQINDVLRGPLKFAVSKFITQYKLALENWNGETHQFESFNAELSKIFRFAL